MRERPSRQGGSSSGSSRHHHHHHHHHASSHLLDDQTVPMAPAGLKRGAGGGDGADSDPECAPSDLKKIRIVGAPSLDVPPAPAAAASSSAPAAI